MTTSKKKTTKSRKTRKKKEFSILQDLLTPLYKADTKGLASGKYKKNAPEKVKEAFQEGWLESSLIKGNERFFISQAGKKYFLQNLPLDQKVELIEKKKKEFLASLEILRKAQKELVEFSNLGNEDMQKGIQNFQDHCQNSLDSIEKELENFSHVVNLIQIGESYIQKIWEERSRFVEELECAKEKSEEKIQFLEKEIQNLSSQIHGFQNIVQKKETIENSEVEIEEKELIGKIEYAYREISRKHLDNIVDFPQLYKQVKQELPRLSIPYFLKTLKSLYDRDIVDLIHINDRSELRFPEFSIPTPPLGEVYYVLWR